MNAARAFCGGGHRRRGSSVLPTSISTDALRTIHLTCCESVTVSSCLADNMAKGIHLNRPTTTKTQIRVNERLVGKATLAHLWQDKNKQ